MSKSYPTLTLKGIDDMRHCIGLDRQSPYRRNNCLYYKPYRNYFTTSSNGSDYCNWVGLECKDLAAREVPESTTFRLTPYGFETLSRYLDVNFIHDTKEKN